MSPDLSYVVVMSLCLGRYYEEQGAGPGHAAVGKDSPVVLASAQEGYPSTPRSPQRGCRSRGTGGLLQVQETHRT